MTPWQTEQLRRALERRREALIDELHRDAQRARDEQFGKLTGPTHDLGDESVAALLADLDQAEPAAARCVDCQRRHEKTYRP